MDEPVHEWRRNDLVVSTDRARIDLDLVHAFLSRSYWAAGIPREIVERSIRHSVCFGIYRGSRQVGFARVVSDLATFGYLADVFVVEDERGRGLSKWLLQCIREHPALQGLRRWMLATRDAHGLYRRFGFVELNDPGRLMEILDPDVYVRPSGRR
jgi:N-acetylglutamate synthase-like GNAT family acetyltransferase